HPDQNIVADGAGMDDGSMANSHVVSHQTRILVSQMQHRVVLDVCVVSDDYPINVSAQNRVVPDARIIPDCHVADHHRSLSEINMGTDGRLLLQKGFKLLERVCHANRLKQEPMMLPIRKRM